MPPDRKTRIYPIFLPHFGCPFQCVYCNQTLVTAPPDRIPSASALLPLVRNALAEQVRYAGASALPGEIAFYGGTFTALPPGELREILDAATPHVRQGTFTGIRFSTRPDRFSQEICSLLAEYPVQTVELGAQSLSDAVLSASRRGYTAADVKASAALVRQYGWSLGLQLMPGLPADTLERFLDSVSGAIALKPQLVRLYPTLVLAETLLAEWYRKGMYQPLSLEEAIAWCTPAYDRLLEAGVAIARMGLQADPELQKPGRILAGPHHPALGYLVRVHWWRERIDRCLQGLSGLHLFRRLTLRAARASISEILGPRRSNLAYWQNKWELESVAVVGEPHRPPRNFEWVLE